MAYVTEEFYKDTWHGEELSPENFTKYNERAQIVIDTMTGYEIAKTEKGLDDFSEFIQGQVRKAVCAQIDYIAVNGIETITTGEGNNAQDATIGGFHYGSKTASSTKLSNVLAPLVVMLLEPTGLLTMGRLKIGFI